MIAGHAGSMGTVRTNGPEEAAVAIGDWSGNGWGNGHERVMRWKLNSLSAGAFSYFDSTFFHSVIVWGMFPA